jgi:hypothetical protein
LRERWRQEQVVFQEKLEGRKQLDKDHLMVGRRLAGEAKWTNRWLGERKGSWRRWFFRRR